MEAENAAFTVALALALLVVLVAGAGFYLTIGKGEAKSRPQQQQQAEGSNRNARRRDRMRPGLRNRARGGPAAEEEEEAEDHPDEEDDDGEPMTRKEAKKRAQRDARRAQDAAREAKEKKKNVYDDRRRAKEEEREAQEAAQAAETLAAEEERKRKEDEDDAKWMRMFQVDEGGTGEDEVAAEDQGLLARFVDFIKERKTVLLEEVAAEFGLRVMDVINRLQGLEEMGRITGVMDDRGKYIYISMEEMQAVAEYIKGRGRIAISELALKSNTFIDLEAKDSAVPSSGGAPAALDFNIDALDEAPDALEAAA